MKQKIILLLLIAAGIFAAGLPARAQSVKTDAASPPPPSASPAAAITAPLTGAQKAEIGEIVKAYLHDNPEVILGAISAYQEKQQKKVMEQAEKKVGDYQEELTGLSNPSIGPATADVTITEFFDYNCGYCKKAFEDLNAFIQSDKNVRLVLKDFPILSPSSRLAAEWALASNKQGKYFEYHKALMGHHGAYDEDSLKKLGKEAGLDVDRLAKDAKSADIEKTINHDIDVAKNLGIMGTPGFVINGKLYPGYLGEEGLKNAVVEARGEKQ